jgi:hypothetical protein
LPSPIAVAFGTMTTINYAIAKTNIASKRLIVPISKVYMMDHNKSITDI